MIIRKSFLFLFFSISFYYLKSQDTLFSYFNKSWQLTSRDSAEFYRKAFKTEKDKYMVCDYYISGKLQMTGTYASKKLDKKEGKFTYYFENGNKSSEGYFVDDEKTGDWQYWYKNGQLYTKSRTDTLWGRIVEDPYRWLERIDSKETLDWLKAQQKIKAKYEGDVTGLSAYLDHYSRIQFVPIFREGAYYFSYRLEETNETPSLYYRKTDTDAPKFLFNPNHLSKSDNISIDGIKMSSDNTTLALVLGKNGSDWKEIRFLDIASKKLLKDTISFVKYSNVHWHENGVFYIKYNVRSTYESMVQLIKEPELYYHKLGTNQDQDILIFKHKNEYSFFHFDVTPEGKYLVLYYGAINQKNAPVHKISLIELSADNLTYEKKEFITTSNTKAEFNVLGVLNGKLLIESTLNAPNGAIYQADPKVGNKLIPFLPQYNEQLQSAKIINRKIVSVYANDKQSHVLVIDSLGKTEVFWNIPESFKISAFSGSLNDSIAIYSLHSFFSPSSFHKINLNTFDKKPLSVTLVNFDNKNIVTEKVYYYSKDSTRIPMYLTHERGLKLNGKNPTILYGYGGFGISMEPFFSVAHIIFFRNGGILATPGIRGGGEFPGWHEKGMRLNKQNTFDDFIAAAEYLIANKYTNSGKLAAMGGSHGGLLVGAAMIQRPELFKVVVSRSGVFDMIRFRYFNVGYSYDEEFGNIHDSLDFENLIRYSPIHNVKKGVNFPATLLVASDNDDRVNPFHSFKFLAQLQANGTGTNPYVLYYQEKSGHSGSNIFDNRIQTEAYVYSFIFKYLDIADKMNYGY